MVSVPGLETMKDV